jgi:hypothetical protein
VKEAGHLRVVAWSLVLAAAVAAFSLAYSNRVARQSEAKWCQVINTLHAGFQSSPEQPLSDRAARLRHDFAQLRISLGCD